jgi:AcrR family transcriptional regulator
MTLPKATYHHGNLRAELIEAGLQLARDGGPDAVVLREVSRRAGVSHNAAYRHFADRDSLLKAICDRCMRSLARLMEQRIEEVGPARRGVAAARARLRATGAAYVEFALKEPGLFRTAFAVPPGLGYLEDDEGVGDGGLGPLEILQAQLDAVWAASGLPLERRENAELAAWSSVHGLSMLLLEGPLREVPEGERGALLTRVLDTVERGL